MPDGATFICNYEKSYKKSKATAKLDQVDS